MSVLRILAFDPAITDMGWAFILYDTETERYVVKESGVIRGSKLISGMTLYQKRFQKSFMTAMKMYDAIVALIFKFRPNYLASEGAFYSKFPQAWASLTVVIHTLKRAWYYTIETTLSEVAHRVMGDDVYLVAPMETKKTISGNGHADKDLIKSSILKYKNLTILSPDREKLTEHEYDAIGHGVTFCVLRLPDIRKEEKRRFDAHQLVMRKKKISEDKEAQKAERRRVIEEKRRHRDAQSKKIKR